MMHVTVVKRITSTTKAEKIHFMLTVLALWVECYHLHHLQFSASYHGADIEVNNIYFDEAHNSVKKNFFPATEFLQRTQMLLFLYSNSETFSDSKNQA